MKLTEDNHNDTAREIQINNFSDEIGNYLTNSFLQSNSNEIVSEQLQSCLLDTKRTNKDQFQIVLTVDYIKDC